jgi:hypothetical protein
MTTDSGMLAHGLALLEARRVAICDEISERAGAAVAACDADFNALLAERAEIVAALVRLAPFARGEARVPHPREG